MTIHQADLSSLEAIGDASVDHVVGVSALEHNDQDRLPSVFAELWRVLRPGGTFAVTVGAAAGSDWYHAPSRGWCFSESTLRRVFEVDPSAPADFDRYEEILAAVRACDELRLNLAPLYFRGGDNGMPWGRWDPTYLSVGVRRDKPPPK